MPRPLRVFLCHASQDKSVVRELYQRLSTENWIDPWLDEENISLGQHWTTVIEEALDQSDVVLIFLSRNSVHKEGFIQRELNYAWELSLEKPREVIFLIPLRLCDCEIPRFLNNRQWGDYFGEKKEGAYRTLLRSLKKRYEQKMGQEEADLETQENVALQKAKLEAEEKIKRDKLRREHLQWEIAEQAVRDKEKIRAARKLKQRITAVLGVVGVLALFGLFFVAASLIINLFKPSPTPAITEAPPVTEAPAAPAEPPSQIDLPTESPALGIGSTMVADKDGMTMVYVPAGDFTMGSNDGDADEKPPQTVYLDSFWIDQTEVTNAMYALCVADGVCSPPSHVGSPNETRYYNNIKYEDYPVIYVNWDMAKTYCEWAGRSLPTEAQWEKAARGADGNIYPWGNRFDGKRLNFCDVNCTDPYDAYTLYDDENVYLSRVGYYPDGASVYGALDMSGNVWEWVADMYDAYPNGIASASSDFGKQYPVLRGGSWKHTMYDVRASNRWHFSVASDAFNPYSGFRCAQPE